MSLAPELDLQVEIDRLAIETFAKKHTSTLVHVLPSAELDSALNKVSNANNELNRKKFSTKSIDLSNTENDNLIDDFIAQNQNVLGLKSASNKTFDSTKSISKKKIK